MRLEYRSARSVDYRLDTSRRLPLPLDKGSVFYVRIIYAEYEACMGAMVHFAFMYKPHVRSYSIRPWVENSTIYIPQIFPSILSVPRLLYSHACYSITLTLRDPALVHCILLKSMYVPH